MESGVLKVNSKLSEQDAEKILDALNHVWGVSDAEVSVDRSEASFKFDKKMASAQDFAQAVIDAGFTITVKGDSHANL